MYKLLIIAALAFGLSLCGAIIFLFLSEKIGLVDEPGGRKAHKRVTPLIGGIIIFTGCMAVPIIKTDIISWKIIVLMFITLVVGLLDDFFEISAYLRLVLQFFIGLGMALSLDQPFITLGNIMGLGSVALGFLAIPFICFSVSAAKNALNMVDGIDGLAGVLALIPTVAIFFLASRGGVENLAAISIALLVAVTVFLCLNFPLENRPHAVCFLGDSGSTLLGFSIAYLLISSATAGLIKPVVALYLFAIPLTDSVSVFAGRVRRRISIAQPGRDHWHHLLIDGGLSARQATLLIGSIAIMIAVVGLVMNHRDVSESTMFYFFIGFMCVNAARFSLTSKFIKFLVVKVRKVYFR
jgi:UDP-GlcNAc:undecaprenyl-phosphate GlcNAc-1-phosphate transferase